MNPKLMSSQNVSVLSVAVNLILEMLNMMKLFPFLNSMQIVQQRKLFGNDVGGT